MSRKPQVKALFETSFADGIVLPKHRAAIGKATGVTAATVSRWVAGEIAPSPQHWSALAKVLHVSVADVKAACAGEPVVTPSSAASPEDIQLAQTALNQSIEALRDGYQALAAELVAVQDRLDKLEGRSFGVGG